MGRFDRSVVVRLAVLAVVGFSLVLITSAHANIEPFDQLGSCSSLDKVVVGPDGNTFAVGSTGDCGNSSHLVMVKLDGEGHLAKDFGDRGIATLPDVVGSRILDLELEPNGKPVVFTNTSIIRLGTDGFPDPDFGDFGSSGVVNADLGAVDSSVESVEAAGIDSSGRMVTAGSGRPLSHPENGNGRPSLKRFKVDGSVDQTFGHDGTVHTDLGTGPPYRRASGMYDLGFGVDGSIYVAGWLRDDSIFSFGERVGAIKYLDNGDVDNSYGHDGIGLASFIDPGYQPNSIRISVKPDGSADLGARMPIGLKPFPNVVRLSLNSDGADTSADDPYVVGGYYSGAVDVSGANTYVTQVNPYSFDGEGPPSEFIVGGYDGSTHPLGGFDESGLIETRIGPGTSAAADLALSSNGQLTAVGSVNRPSCSDKDGLDYLCSVMVIERLDTQTGDLDRNFGDGRGIATIPDISCAAVTVNGQEPDEAIGSSCNREALKLAPRIKITHARSRKPVLVLNVNLYQEQPYVSPPDQVVILRLPKALKLRVKGPAPFATQKTDFAGGAFDLPWVRQKERSRLVSVTPAGTSSRPLRKLRVVIPRGALRSIPRNRRVKVLKVGVSVGYRSEYLGFRTAHSRIGVRIGSGR